MDGNGLVFPRHRGAFLAWVQARTRAFLLQPWCLFPALLESSGSRSLNVEAQAPGWEPSRWAGGAGTPTPPDAGAHHGLTEASAGDADLGQESVRAAGHLPGPPLLGAVHSPWQLPPRTGRSWKLRPHVGGLELERLGQGVRFSLHPRPLGADPRDGVLVTVTLPAVRTRTCLLWSSPHRGPSAQHPPRLGPVQAGCRLPLGPSAHRRGVEWGLSFPPFPPSQVLGVDGPWHLNPLESFLPPADSPLRAEPGCLGTWRP